MGRITAQLPMKWLSSMIESSIAKGASGVTDWLCTLFKASKRGSPVFVLSDRCSPNTVRKQICICPGVVV